MKEVAEEMPENRNPNTEIANWSHALAINQLSEEQRKVLEQMVAEGQAKTLAEAARLLDWQTEGIEQESSMWGP